MRWELHFQAVINCTRLKSTFAATLYFKELNLETLYCSFLGPGGLLIHLICSINWFFSFVRSTFIIFTGSQTPLLRKPIYVLETAILLDSFACKQAPTTYTAMIAQLKYNNEVKIVDLSGMCTHVWNCNPSPKIAGKINVGSTNAGKLKTGIEW